MPFSCLDLLDYIFSSIISGMESALDEAPRDFLSYTQARLPWPECLLKSDSDKAYFYFYRIGLQKPRSLHLYQKTERAIKGNHGSKYIKVLRYNIAYYYNVVSICTYVSVREKKLYLKNSDSPLQTTVAFANIERPCMPGLIVLKTHVSKTLLQFCG